MDNIEQLNFQVAEEMFLKLEKEFTIFFTSRWLNMMDDMVLRNATKAGYLKILARCSKSIFLTTLDKIVCGESEFEYPPTPAEFIKLYREFRASAAPAKEKLLENNHVELTADQRAWDAQCLKNNPWYIQQMAEEETSVGKMKIKSAAYYAGIEKIPADQMKIYEMLEKNINRRQDMHLNEN